MANRGVCIWLTGRSGAGKSTVTQALVPLLAAHGRTVSVLDVVPLLAKRWCERTSEGKLLRKAFVAGEIARHGGVAICVTVSARADVRARARTIVGNERFLEVHCDTPAVVTARRKAARTRRPPLHKRLRRAARALRALLVPREGYEPPAQPDLRLDTLAVAPQESARAVLDLLARRGFLDVTAPPANATA